MAAQTCFQSLLRRQFGESFYRGLPSARFDMRFSGSVATLASRALGRLTTRGNALVVRILVKIQINVGMTRTADGAADVLRGLSRGRARGGSSLERRRKKGHKSEEERRVEGLHFNTIENFRR